MTWQLAIDFGTTFTTAAVWRDGEARMLSIGQSTNKLPSSALLVGNELVVGEAAVNQAALYPDRFVPTPKRHLGFDRTLLLGEAEVETVDVVAAVLKRGLAEAVRQQPEHELDRIVLTHPALWSDSKKGHLEEALKRSGYGSGIDVRLCAEPVAAAAHYVRDDADTGQLVAVYDLGGGTLDTAVLQRKPGGFQLIGRPGGEEYLGGEDFDEVIFEYLLDSIKADDPAIAEALRSSEEPEWSHARHQLRKGGRECKEQLSFTNQYAFHLPLPVGRDVSLTRTELFTLISEDVERSVACLAATIDEAQILANRPVEAIYLVGGSSRIPAIQHTIERRYGPIVRTKEEPKEVVALGAALIGSPTSAPPPPVNAHPWPPPDTPPNMQWPPPSQPPPPPPREEDRIWPPRLPPSDPWHQRPGAGPAPPPPRPQDRIWPHAARRRSDKPTGSGM